MPLAFATQIVLARWLTVSDRGFYAILTTFSAIVFLGTQLGWGDAVIYRTRRENVSPRRALSTGVLGNGAFALAVALACWLFRSPLSRAFLGDVSARAFLLAAATAPLLAVGDLLCGVARTLDRFDLHNQYGIYQSLGILAGLVGALVFGGGALDAALAVNLAVQAALVLWLGAALAALAGFEWRIDFAEVRASVGYGKNLYVQNLLINLHERVDVLLLAALGVSSVQIGLYAAGVAVVTRLREVPGALGTALLPRLAGATESEAAEFTAAVVRPSLLVMGAAAAVLAPAGAVGIPLLFGTEYAPAIAPFLVLLPGVAAVTVSRVLGRYFAAVNRQRAIVVLRGAVLVLNVALNLWLIPRAGIVGAALASLVSYSAEAAATVALFLADTGRRFGDSLLPRARDFEESLARVRGFLSRALR
ncbi:MAG TPA: oligosaccharide flippase family protein [Myxococcota bacterium]|nr:oligosaccharide flippase family protein [Myxococcota bacterium]